MTTYKGLDYSLGRSNVDHATGIHYGVISQHTIGEAWYDQAEADYGDPHCPKCGNDAIVVADGTSDDYEDFEEMCHGCREYACEDCRILFDGEEAFGDEPIGFHFKDSEYTLTDCLDSDVFVLRSPYYTYAQFCSPCVPGAGNLNTPCEDGPKTYCLGPEWFEGDKAPYPVYRVSDNSVVEGV